MKDSSYGSKNYIIRYKESNQDKLVIQNDKFLYNYFPKDGKLILVQNLTNNILLNYALSNGSGAYRQVLNYIKFNYININKILESYFGC